MAQKRFIEIPLGISKEDLGATRSAVLELETSKAYNGGVESDAKVMWVGPHSRSHVFGVAGGGGDFSKRVFRSASTLRATQSAIDKQHAAVFTEEARAALTAEAKTYYGAEVTA